MDKVLTRCDRCGGSGIFYTRVENGRGVPAIPDHGICYKCHGMKYIEANLTAELKERVLNLLNKHHIRSIAWIEYYSSHILIYTKDYVFRFPRWTKGKIGVARRTLPKGA